MLPLGKRCPRQRVRKDFDDGDTTRASLTLSLTMTTRLLRAAAGAPALYRTSALRTLAPPRLTASHLRPALSSPCFSRRCLSTDAAEEPSSSSAPLSPKVEALVEQIASLSLLEAAELTEALKVCITNFFSAAAAAMALLCVCVSPALSLLSLATRRRNWASRAQ